MVEQSISDMLRLCNAPGDALELRVKQAQAEFMTHLGEEETLVLPRIAAVCTQQELVALGLAFKSCKQTAPLMPQTAEVQAMNAMAEAGREQLRQPNA